MSWRSEVEDEYTITCDDCKAEYISIDAFGRPVTKCPSCGFFNDPEDQLNEETPIT